MGAGVVDYADVSEGDIRAQLLDENGIAPDADRELDVDGRGRPSGNVPVLLAIAELLGLPKLEKTLQHLLPASRWTTAFADLDKRERERLRRVAHRLTQAVMSMVCPADADGLWRAVDGHHFRSDGDTTSSNGSDARHQRAHVLGESTTEVVCSAKPHQATRVGAESARWRLRRCGTSGCCGG
jgi:hypothetical protein